jgi:hypothetical protein
VPEVLARLGRGARRLGPLGLAALVLVMAVGGAAVWRWSRPAPVSGGAEVVRVGPSPRDLGALPAGRDVYALISFRTYLGPDELAPVLDGVTPAIVFARVPLPDRQPQIVRIPANRLPGDVTAGMDGVAGRKEAEASGYADDATGRSLRELALAEATAYRQHCACVYAAVVRGGPAALASLAQRDPIRVVDPAPDVTRLDRAVWLPPLPDTSGQASNPVAASPTAGRR